MEKEEEGSAFVTTANSGFPLVLCSAEQISAAEHPQGLKFLGVGGRTASSPLSLVVQVAEGIL